MNIFLFYIEIKYIREEIIMPEKNDEIVIIHNKPNEMLVKKDGQTSKVIIIDRSNELAEAIIIFNIGSGT